MLSRGKSYILPLCADNMKDNSVNEEWQYMGFSSRYHSKS